MRSRFALTILLLNCVFIWAPPARAQATVPTQPAAQAPRPMQPAIQPAAPMQPAVQTTAPAVAAAPKAVQAQAPAPLTPTSATPTFSAEAEAEKLIETTHAIAGGEQMAQLIVTPLINKITASSSLPPQKAEEMKKIFQEEFSKAFSDMFVKLKPQLVAAYTQNFTADELHVLNEFYASPVGKKAVTLMPQLMQQGAALGQAEAQKVMPAVMQRIQTRLGNAGIYLPNSK